VWRVTLLGVGKNRGVRYHRGKQRGGAMYLETLESSSALYYRTGRALKHVALLTCTVYPLAPCTTAILNPVAERMQQVQKVKYHQQQ
jgi:hypothetical protein